MTYLEIVNAVLRKLRENEVATVSESDYTLMIGAFVNDAKRLVEDAWDWSALRTTQEFLTVAGTDTYTLSGFGTRSEVFQVFDETHKKVLDKISIRDARRRNLLSGSEQGELSHYAMAGVGANGDIQIKLFPTPEKSDCTISVYGIKRPEDLVNDADSIYVATNVIVDWATAYALIERGETGGQSGSEQALFAKNSLSNAIALDARYHDEELNWTVV